MEEGSPLFSSLTIREKVTDCQREEMLIRNMNQMMSRDRYRLHSPPFIAKYNGCKFCLRVAFDKEKVSVGIQLTKGDRDKHFFGMMFILELKNQDSGKDRVIMFHCGMVPKPNLSIARQHLLKEGFIKNDMMLLRCYLFPKGTDIDLIKSEYPSICPSLLSSSQTSPSVVPSLLQNVPSSEPVLYMPSSEQPSDVCSDTEPDSDVPSTEPVSDVPSTEPVSDVPSTEPVSDVPSTEPVSDVSSTEPVSDVPSTESVSDVPSTPLQDEPLIMSAQLNCSEKTVALLPQHLPYKSTALLKKVPFIEGIRSYSCDHHGATLSIHDITVTIPPGAIPDEVTAHIEMGVALYGPFKFPDNCQPVSPILWFCILEDIELLLPLTYRLPHVIIDMSEVNITFAKTNHLTYQNSMKRDVFTFEPVCIGESDFARESGYGYLSSKHCCFLCLSAENVTKDIALKKGYCLHILIENISPSSYRILLIFTYFLKTCFEVCHNCASQTLHFVV